MTCRKSPSALFAGGRCCCSRRVLLRLRLSLRLLYALARSGREREASGRCGRGRCEAHVLCTRRCEERGRVRGRGGRACCVRSEFIVLRCLRACVSPCLTVSHAVERRPTSSRSVSVTHHFGSRASFEERRGEGGGGWWGAGQ